jgi:hypothetical protein
MNSQTFVSDFIEEFTSHPECYDDVVDLLDATLDDIVSNNTIEENKQIIVDYSGDVFIAINLYKEHLGNVEELYSDMNIFYQQLAFISLFVKFYPIIEIKLRKHCNFATFTNNFRVELTTNSDFYGGKIAGLIDEIISLNGLDVNKQIISDYYVGNDVFQDFSKMKEATIEQLAFIALFSILNSQLGFSIIK